MTFSQKITDNALGFTLVMVQIFTLRLIDWQCSFEGEMWKKKLLFNEIPLTMEAMLDIQ